MIEMFLVPAVAIAGVLVGGIAMYIYKNAVIVAMEDAFDFLRQTVDDLEDALQIEDEDE